MPLQGTRAAPDNRGAEAAARYRGEREARQRRPPAWGVRTLQWEDAVLAAWVLALEEIVRRWYGVEHLGLQLLGGHTEGDGWLAYFASLSGPAWVLLALFLFLLLTRGPEDTDRDVALGRRWPMLGLALPALSVYALVASGVQALVTGEARRMPSGEPPWPGPYVPGIVRRIAAVPVALIGDWLFRLELAQSELGTVSSLSLSDGLSVTQTMLLVVMALPYMLFVAGPRIAAGAELAWRPWILRYALFVGATLLSALNL